MSFEKACAKGVRDANLIVVHPLGQRGTAASSRLRKQPAAHPDVPLEGPKALQGHGPAPYRQSAAPTALVRKCSDGPAPRQFRRACTAADGAGRQRARRHGNSIEDFVCLAVGSPGESKLWGRHRSRTVADSSAGSHDPAAAPAKAQGRVQQQQGVVAAEQAAGGQRPCRGPRARSGQDAGPGGLVRSRAGRGDRAPLRTRRPAAPSPLRPRSAPAGAEKGPRRRRTAWAVRAGPGRQAGTRPGGGVQGGGEEGWRVEGGLVGERSWISV